jgi:hypothetical protein
VRECAPFARLRVSACCDMLKPFTSSTLSEPFTCHGCASTLSKPFTTCSRSTFAHTAVACGCVREWGLRVRGWARVRGTHLHVRANAQCVGGSLTELGRTHDARMRARTRASAVASIRCECRSLLLQRARSELLFRPPITHTALPYSPTQSPPHPSRCRCRRCEYSVQALPTSWTLRGGP